MRRLADIASKQQMLKDLEKAMANVRNLPEQIASLQKAIDFLEKKLPNAKEMDRVLNEVWEKAKDNNLNIKSVRNSKAIEGTSYSEQPIKMVIEGQFYPGFFKFLTDVEQMPRLTKINEMKLTADPKVPGVITAELTLSIYFEASQKVAVAQ